MPKEAISAIKSLVSRAFELALDTIAPPDLLIRKIERMSSSEFSKKASLPDASQDIEGMTALFSYKDEMVRASILEVKSYGNKKIARLLGSVAYDYILAELSDLALFRNFASPLLVTVPLTRKCLRRRGWNQCDLIAEGIALADGSRCIEIRTNALAKMRETEDQVGKTRSERFANLKGCFAARRAEDVRGRNVIVLDDIATTGATLGEARKALLRAGAKKVWCVAIAR